MTSLSISAGSTSGHCIPTYISSCGSSVLGDVSFLGSVFSAADGSVGFGVATGLVSSFGFVAVVCSVAATVGLVD